MARRPSYDELERQVERLSKLQAKHKRLEDRLRRSEAHYRLLAENVTDVIWTMDMNRQFTYISPSVVHLSGYTNKEAMALNLEDMYTPASLEAATKAFAEETNSEHGGQDAPLRPRALELEMIRGDGSTVWTEVRTTFLRGPDGHPTGALGVTRDITERRRMQEETAKNRDHLKKLVEERTAELTATIQQLHGEIENRRRAEEALATAFRERNEIVQCMGDGLIVFDNKGEVVVVNHAYEEMTGLKREKVTGKDGIAVASQTVKPEECEKVKAAFLQALAGHAIPQIQATLVRADGRETPVYFTTSFVQGTTGEDKSIIAVLKDMTERKRIEEELGKIDKLESLGILAGGIAHDFNNLLTPILANISIVKMYGDPDQETVDLLTDVEKAALRAKGLAQQLLTFGKGGEPIRKPLSLSRSFLKDIARLALSGSNVRCDVLVPDGLWLVEADQGQISQVIHNLIINADQAMPEGGIVKLRAENVCLEENERPGLRGGRHVKISLADQGQGIIERRLSKIFDPFFTTKEKGRGLGLATSLSIVNRHGGHIEVTSEVGVGTVFDVYLPAGEGQSEAGEATKATAIRGQGRILLVDDEEMVRKSAQGMLERLGYEVTLAKEGAEGISLYEGARRSGRPFRLVIIDLTIPGGMGGKEAIKRLKKTDPGVKAIVCSGYSHDPVMADFAKHGFSGVITKPYSIEELAQGIHQVLLAGND